MRHIFCGIFMAYLFLLPIAFAGSFAAGPGTIRYENLLKSGYAETEIYVTNPEDVPAEITISGAGQIVGWLSFYPQTFQLEAHEVKTVIAIIRPPWDVANGLYNGSVNVVSKPLYKRFYDVQYGLNIETAINLWVFAEVTGEQIIDFSVSDFSVRNVEVGSSVPFVVSGNNNGNVRVTPMIYAEIYNVNKSVLILSHNFTGESIMPTTKSTQTFHLPADDLSTGQYWLNLSVFTFDRFAGSRMLTFDVVREGTLTVFGDLIQVTTSKIWASPGDIVRIDGIFKNTGELPTDAKFKAEVHCNDRLVETIESDEILVDVGSTVNLTTYYTPEDEGRCVVEGAAYYSGKITYMKSTIVNVFIQKSNIFEEHKYLIISTLLLLFALLSVHFYGRFSAEKKTHDFGSVSGKYDSVENNLETLARRGERLKKKISRMRH
ncbi:hypothetical protein GQ472_04820 [archaeon]|nr:hypothetical protein [archaeon]